MINRTPSPDSSDSTSPNKSSTNYGTMLANQLFGDQVQDQSYNGLEENVLSGQNLDNYSNMINLGVGNEASK